MIEKLSPHASRLPKSMTDRPYHHGNLREAIVAAALDVLGDKEPSELSLRDLARMVGVGHSALYSHFRDRGELLAVIAGEGFRILLLELRHALGKGTQDPLAALVTAYLHFARTNPAHYRTMFRPESAAPENAIHVEEWCGGCFQTLLSTLKEQRHLPEEKAFDCAVGIWSTLHGLALLGDAAGPLHQKVPKENEVDLAINFANALVGAE
ncbi:TetR/AcrR family transcriptional regulator [Hoeflea sp. BAL378]|uniref:TetR/AcrR family transcriptional regulator n=1 Tax=Hoeflea sp. BAL378 TaxID=1547437 RepID=UPI00068AC1D1|nr:TetR/AcrR family transcriptional regulator [Hoeflea sp. BAL378]